MSTSTTDPANVAQRLRTASGKAEVAISSRLASAVLGERFISSRGKLAAGFGCAIVLTYLLLSSDPWWLFRALPRETTRALRSGPIDKVYHLLAYFGLTSTLMWYAAAKSKRVFIMLTAAVTAHAFVTETLQQFVPRRTTDVEDLIANLVGVSSGVAAGVLLRRSLHAESCCGELAAIESSFRTVHEKRKGRSEELMAQSTGSTVNEAWATDSPAVRMNAGGRWHAMRVGSESRPRRMSWRVLLVISATAVLTFALSVGFRHGILLHHKTDQPDRLERALNSSSSLPIDRRQTGHGA